MRSRKRTNQPGGAMRPVRSSTLSTCVLFLLALALTVGTAAASGSARLPREVLPTFERIKLNLDARKKSYAGTVHIDLSVKSAVDSFQFHSEGINLPGVTLRDGKSPGPLPHPPAGAPL